MSDEPTTPTTPSKPSKVFAYYGQAKTLEDGTNVLAGGKIEVILTFDVSEEQAAKLFAVGLARGGHVAKLVEPIIFEQFTDAKKEAILSKAFKAKTLAREAVRIDLENMQAKREARQEKAAIEDAKIEVLKEKLADQDIE